MARSLHATAPETGWPEYEKRRAELLRLSGQHANVRAELARHDADRRKAENTDREAFGLALRAGKPDPGPNAVLEWEAAGRELRRKLDALGSAIATIETEMTELVRSHEKDYRAEAVRVAEQRRSEFAAAVEEVIEAREAWVAAREAELLVDVIVSGEGRPATNRRHRVVGFIAPNGEPFNWEVLATALRGDAAPEVPKPKMVFRRETELVR
jgi:hypothetical protein